MTADKSLPLPDVNKRLSFMELGKTERADVAALGELVARELPKALDKFYGKVKATPETDGQPVCIALREWTPGRPPDTYTGQAEGSVTASADEWREVKVRYVAQEQDNTIDLHVYRYPGEMQANESFLVDAITLAPGTDTSENTQLVDDATCGA